MAVFEVATIAGIALGFALGGFLWDRLQVGAFVVIMVIFLVASCVFMLVQGEGLEGRQHRGWQTYQSLLRHRAILGFMPSWLAVNAVLGIWFTHLSFQMAQAVNPDQFLVGGLQRHSSGTGDRRHGRYGSSRDGRVDAAIRLAAVPQP